MIARPFDLAIPAGTAPDDAGVAAELEQALDSWRSFCDRAAAGVAGHDLEAADQALGAREALRPRITELVARLRATAPPARETLRAIESLQKDAAEAESRLVNVLEGERFRLRREIDGAGRPSAPVSAYGRATESSPHRLDIVR